MLNRLIYFISIISLFLNFSCASILKGTTETIHVKSEVPGTRLYLGKHEIGTDSGSIKVSKKRLKNAQLRAEKEGCETTKISIPTRFDNTTLLGLFLDLGVVSILIVDWGIYGSTQEAQKLSFVLSPVCKE